MLTRTHFNDLAIIAKRIIFQHPHSADVVLSELMQFCENTNPRFKRDYFLKAIVVGLAAAGKLPSNSHYIDDFLLSQGEKEKAA